MAFVFVVQWHVISQSFSALRLIFVNQFCILLFQSSSYGKSKVQYNLSFNFVTGFNSDHGGNRFGRNRLRRYSHLQSLSLCNFLCWITGRALMRSSKIITETVSKSIPSSVSFAPLLSFAPLANATWIADICQFEILPRWLRCHHESAWGGIDSRRQSICE